MDDQELRIYSPTGIVGYGFGEDFFRIAVNKGLHLIACDGGSTDPRPKHRSLAHPTLVQCFNPAANINRKLFKLQITNYPDMIGI